VDKRLCVVRYKAVTGKLSPKKLRNTRGVKTPNSDTSCCKWKHFLSTTGRYRMDF